MLGAILISQNNTNVIGALTKAGVPGTVAHRVAASIGSGAPGGRSAGGEPHALVHDVQVAFAHSTQTVFYIMAAVMVATFIVSVRGLPRGRVAAPAESELDPTAVAVEAGVQEA